MTRRGRERLNRVVFEDEMTFQRPECANRVARPLM
jgi:hypothetical protein